MQARSEQQAPPDSATGASAGAQPLLGITTQAREKVVRSQNEKIIHFRQIYPPTCSACHRIAEAEDRRGVNATRRARRHEYAEFELKLPDKCYCVGAVERTNDHARSNGGCCCLGADPDIASCTDTICR